MADLRSLTNIWKNIKEFELRPILLDAQRDVKITLVGAPGSGRHTLAAGMRHDPDRADVYQESTLPALDTQSVGEQPPEGLVVMLLDASLPDHPAERDLCQRWVDAGKKLIVIYNLREEPAGEQSMQPVPYWEGAKVLLGSVQDKRFLVNRFAPVVLDMLPGLHLALGRLFPLFRSTIANRLINDACFANGAYAFSTSLAETVPVLAVPINITDMLILTKAQAFLVYRLGLLLGFSTHWQDYVAEFGSVIGSGFLWRQFARQLVGLIPVWGIIPKVAVSYAGTYVVGHTVLRWYLTGKHLTRQQVAALYGQALTRGKLNAQKLAERLPRLGKGKAKEKKKKKLAAAPSLPAGTEGKTCAACGNLSAVDAKFCQYCGKEF